MGETFTNSGVRTLTANYASIKGQAVQRVQFFEGVPGRNGTVTQLTEGNGTWVGNDRKTALPSPSVNR